MTHSVHENLQQDGSLKPILVTLVVSTLAAGASYLTPLEHSATAVGLCFLGATYVLCLRDDDPNAARRWGLSLGGLLDPEPMSLRRLMSDLGRAMGWALACSLLFLPPFWFGFRIWYGVDAPFAAPGSLPDWSRLMDDVLGHALVIALPEEAFFRGYVQTRLDRVWPPTIEFLKARLGWSLVVTSALFAVGHLATAPDPGRLAVFFPSLVFGFLRARTGGIGAAVAFHTICNVFAALLSRGYGLAS